MNVPNPTSRSDHEDRELRPDEQCDRAVLMFMLDEPGGPWSVDELARVIESRNDAIDDTTPRPIGSRPPRRRLLLPDARRPPRRQVHRQPVGALLMSSHGREEEERRQLIGFGRALHEARVRRGLSERGLSVAVERPLEDILALEAGDLDPPYDLMLALAEQLGVSLSTLVCRAQCLQDQAPPWRSPLIE